MKKIISIGMIAILFLAGAAFAKGKTTLTGQVNINKASLQELAMLPGIGPKAAKAIVDYRQKKTFVSIDELLNVKGVGKKTLAELRSFVVTQGPTTAKLLKAKKSKKVASK